jgi:hypothetical protein
MRLNIDSLIQTSAGISLSTLSISGLMCINTICTKPQNDESNNCPVNSPGLHCSRINLNIGLSAMGITGTLLVFRGLRM